MRDLNLSDEDVKVLVDFLSSCKDIEMLDLAGNSIGNEGAKYLCDLLSLNLPTEELCLARDIRKEDTGDFITNEGAKALIDALKAAYEADGWTLKCLDLRGNPTGLKMQEVFDERNAGLYDTTILLDSDILRVKEHTRLLCEEGDLE